MPASSNIALTFATSNAAKYREAKAIFEREHLILRRARTVKIEPQNDSPVDIARSSLLSILPTVPPPVFVEEAGLFINTYGGFPGPYSSYVHRTIGCRGILKLMENDAARSAEFRAVAALAWTRDEIEVFEGSIQGQIAWKERGDGGFGFDPIFIPQGQARTFAEMSIIEKSLVSHRTAAYRKLIEWCLGRVA
jgi:XTP/dITP diphosphohydrolase